MDGGSGEGEGEIRKFSRFAERSQENRAASLLLSVKSFGRMVTVPERVIDTSIDHTHAAQNVPVTGLERAHVCTCGTEGEGEGESTDTIDFSRHTLSYFPFNC
jgi:hypothetical protein